MPCDSRPLRRNQTLEQRMKQDKKNLENLERKLQAKQVKVVIGPNGAVMFQGWKAEDRDGLTDVCTYRTLMASNSFALKIAIQQAEMLSGKKVNPMAVASGFHSHDGKTWGKD